MECEASRLKEEGNAQFKCGEYEKAKACYSKAIKQSMEQKELAVLHRNRAACHLKLVCGGFAF